MKIEKFKVLLYLKKSGMDKNGKAPIMGRITVNRTMAQFSCKLSCTPSLWNPRASRLEGKSKEAVETNKDIEQLLLSIQKAFDALEEKRTDLPCSYHSGRHSFASLITLEAGVLISLKNIRQFWETELAWIP